MRAVRSALLCRESSLPAEKDPALGLLCVPYSSLETLRLRMKGWTSPSISQIQGTFKPKRKTPSSPITVISDKHEEEKRQGTVSPKLWKTGSLFGPDSSFLLLTKHFSSAGFVCLVGWFLLGASHLLSTLEKRAVSYRGLQVAPGHQHSSHSFQKH